MPIDRDELERLSPEERLAKLRELEEERRNEMAEIEQLIRSSETDARVKELVVDQTEVPESPTVDISALFAGDESALESGIKAEAAQPEEHPATTYAAKTEENAATYAPKSEEAFPAKADDSIHAIRYESRQSQKAVEQSGTSRGVLKNIKKYQVG